MTAMEKDLRDAYAALKLLRADLVKTRRDKRALEASLTHLQIHGPPPNAAQTRKSRETQQMQHEDASAQLWRLAAIYEGRLTKMEKKLAHNNCQKKEDTSLEAGDNQEGDEETEGMEKLALLNKLHSLTATVEQQTQTMLAQQASFSLQKGELETTLEDTQHQVQMEKTKAADALLWQQATKENYDFLETQVEIIKDEKMKLVEEKQYFEMKLAAHAQTNSILKQQLEEKEEERKQWESEQEERDSRLSLEHEQKVDALVEELSARFRREYEMKEKELSDEHQQELIELQRKLGLLELKLSSEKESKLQDQKETQEPYATTLRDLENCCKELKAQVATLEAMRSSETKEREAQHAEAQERYAAMLHDLEVELEEARQQLTALEIKRTTERKTHDMQFQAALEKLRVKEKKQEEQAVTLCDRETILADTKSKLAATEAKLTEEAMKHEEQFAEASQKLIDQEHDKERRLMTVRTLKNNLAEVQGQLADNEARRLSEVKEYEEKVTQFSQLAARHETTARVLANENKALEQEVREARQTLKSTTEQLLECQSIKQKTQERLQHLNQVQVQCESLETQLLLAEDHKEVSLAGATVEYSYTLKAFHGLSDKEIAALPLSKSWALLRSGIVEIGDFLANLPHFVSAMSDVLTLCESHAATLPALCNRLEGKISNEKGQLPTVTVALKLMRFAVMLNSRIKQEESPVTLKLVETLRRRVLEALAQWYECDVSDSEQGGNGSMPIPTFTITSRETTLILQNWTNDRTKQLGVRRWLARMEAYPGVPPLRGASSNRVLELPPEGCTLELEDMTPEVKDAFLLLLIPILKQNRALHVRVFTRYVRDRHATSKQKWNSDKDSHEDAQKVWAMRIHVQSTVTQRTRPIGKPRPSPLKLITTPHSPPSPLAPVSPASSVSSSASSTTSSRRQIIQERLQYLHNNAQ